MVSGIIRKEGPSGLLRNRWAALLHDIGWVPLAFLGAYWLRYDLGNVPQYLYEPMGLRLAVVLPLQAGAFWLFGLYRGIWRFASLADLARILKAVWGGTAFVFLMLFLVFRLEGVPRSVIVLYPLLLTAGLTAPRLGYRWLKDHRLCPVPEQGERALIVGAGRAGELLVRDLVRDESYQPLGLLDDDASKKGRELHGVPVLGPISDLKQRLEAMAVEVVLIAMPSASRRTMRQVVDVCSKHGVRCVTLPSMSALADGKVSAEQLRDVRIDDLLGRDPVVLDGERIDAFLAGKRVMVSGAGGSIGSELCRQVGDHEPARLIMVDSAEFNLYAIDHEMRDRCLDDGRLIPVLCDVRDEAGMRAVFEAWQPEVVLHAAAYKHVPLLEVNALEGVRTNTMGTRVMADLAAAYGVEKFLLVSTDKAVNPANVMGASKRTAEVYCQGLNARSRTAFVTTRFGNVLGSAGSVVPLFRRQIEQGGPVTVTHPEITRYFMTIPEAVSLILQAAAMGEGGEVFVLDMGEPVKIIDLAREMIRLCGRELDVDVEIQITGLRPGEKLHEELFYGSEDLRATAHPQLMQAQASQPDWRRLQADMETLAGLCQARDTDGARQLVHAIAGGNREVAAAPSESLPPAAAVR